MTRITISLFLLLAWGIVGIAQDDHSHGLSSRAVKKPRIFLDKSPRIVAYQLKRLKDAQLLLVDREPTDLKYAPVYEAILSRPKIDAKQKLEAASGLALLRKTSVVIELLTALGSVAEKDVKSAGQLIDLLVRRDPRQLAEAEGPLDDALKADHRWQRIAAAAARMITGTPADQIDTAPQHVLAGIAVIPDAKRRDAEADFVVEMLTHSEMAVREAAIAVSPTMTERAAEFTRGLAERVGDDPLDDAIVAALLKMPVRRLNDGHLKGMAERLIRQTEQTEPAMRTTDIFLARVELIGQALEALPSRIAQPLRARLREVAVRLVRIGTVEEEMRYDRKYFVAEAGRDVQIILDNHDLMPHNLVVTIPGKLKDVAAAGLAVGPSGGLDGKGYVPHDDAVLFATTMVPAGQSDRLTFTAPDTPGEYPYVCTFPQHWSRMYGVMLVVEDLDAYLEQPFEPEDPIGSNRSFVASWTEDDFPDDLSDALRGRQPAIGKKIFEEASCQTCHKIRGQGGGVGPELTDVFQRWKGDVGLVLREILDPSACIDEKYAMRTILTVDGQTVSGLVESETDESITLINDPESGKPIVVPQDEIEEMIQMKTSMMPKGLMNQYTKDEILELLAYLRDPE